MRRTNDLIEKYRAKKGSGPPTKASFYICEYYQDWQIQVFQVLNKLQFDENNKLIGSFKASIVEGLNLNEKTNKKEMSNALQFASFIVKETEKYGKESLEHRLPFKETETLKNYEAYILQMTNLKEISISIGKEAKELGIATPGTPNIVIS